MHQRFSFTFLARVCIHLADKIAFDLFSGWSPGLAVVGGLNIPATPEKPLIECHKGGASGGRIPPPPEPPAITIPALPKPPPPPPPPPTAGDADVVAQQQEMLKNRSRGFGYKASLLSSGNESANTATGKGSLLGGSY
jgi:hypothetical protein